MEKLPEEFKTKLCAALRSGEYKQGHSLLYSSETDSYCCLGVAAVLCGADKEKLKGYSYIGVGHTSYFSPIDEFPPAIIHEYAEQDVAVTLATMNDAQGKTFSQIADWIEKNL